MILLRRLKILLLSIFASTYLSAQTPIANRVNEAARHVSKDASVVAKYTDNKRHSLYYIRKDKFFCLDVVLNINEELNFTPQKYDKILSSYLSPDGEYMFICLDKGNKSGWVLEDRFELWRINSYNRKSSRIASGFTIDRTKEGFLLRKTSRCLNPRAPKSRQRWMVRDHHFDMMGQATVTLPEYEYHF